MTVRQAYCALILLAGVLVGGPARADFTLEPAYPGTPLKGPRAAAGAVVWNHGMNFLYGTEAALAPVPIFVALLRDAGFDVFRLLRPRMEEEPRSGAAAIAATADRLAGEGYRKIVLAGQSAGAWLSLMAASRSEHVYAVIANAPAYYGAAHPAYLKNGFILLDHIDDIRRGRIMISYFKDDPYDPGGRGPASAEVLAQHRVPHLVIDQPDGFPGHFGGNSGLFVRRFGACVLAVVGDGPMPTQQGCESGWGKAPSAELPLPAGFAPARPHGDHTPADRFLGKWYGHYETGCELMLAIERVSGDAVEAVYAVGPGPAHGAAAMLTHRTGRVEGDTLVFADPGKATLRYQLRPDGSLTGEWIAADKRSLLATVLRRVP